MDDTQIQAIGSKVASGNATEPEVEGFITEINNQLEDIKSLLSDTQE
jgi:hypothetical protein